MRFAPFVVFGLALTNVARAEESPPDDRTRYSATFKYAGDAREQAARKAAIDRAVDSMFFAIRGIARSRLDAGTKIDPSVSFAFPPGKIRVRFPGAADALSPDNGAPVDYVDDGEKTKLSQRLMVPGKLTQVYAADEGRRVNEWSLSPDGSTLVVRVTIASPKLSAPAVYLLTYKRAP